MNDDLASAAKQELQNFYNSEAEARSVDDWITEGQRARVPESVAAHYFVGHKVDTALTMAAAHSDGKALEVGSSLGQMTFLLSEKFASVSAVDLSPGCVQLAQRRADHYKVSNVSFRQADAENLSLFDNDSFDVAFSFSALRYVPDPNKAIREIHRTLKPGGIAVFDFPNKYCPWFGPVKKLFGIRKHIHDRLFSAREVADMMAAAGYAEIKTRHLLFTTRRLPDSLLPLFKIIDAVLERIPLINRLAAIIMVKGRKIESR